MTKSKLQHPSHCYGSQPWIRIDSGTMWSARSGHSSVILPDDTIVVMGGFNGSYLNDVWKSADGGITWTQMTADAEWDPRYFHSSVATASGDIILAGGSNAGSYLNDVWISDDDGATWTEQTASAGWVGRDVHTSVTMDDSSILIVGGFSSTGFGCPNDVWRSVDDGANWSQMTGSAEWAKTAQHCTVRTSSDDTILFAGVHTGGTRSNEVWTSSNYGVTWTFTSYASWSARYGSSGVILSDDSIMIMGGFDGGRYNDVWISTDLGITWVVMTTNAEWSARNHHTSVVRSDGAVVLMGGSDDSGYCNDVWELDLG